MNLKVLKNSPLLRMFIRTLTILYEYFQNCIKNLLNLRFIKSGQNSTNPCFPCGSETYVDNVFPDIYASVHWTTYI
ncbi:unnamed protein product [Adineta ricciae]|uniref:Uncharacterized protein n=1 Tax=Adineta ricciae TaxID=249248 RepID=A0A815DBY1_ADIRI|nr:unnamed protein product [Adineta ricciae]